jgi:hypothetical protein
MSVPYYLSFQDEAEANSVLYTTTVTPAVLDEEGNVVTEEVITLTPNFINMSVLGVVYEPAPIPMLDNYVPVPYPAPNFGVNVLVLDGEDTSLIEAYAVQPSPFPQRIWAI